MRGAIADLLAPVPLDFGGGCSSSKAHLMAWLIRHSKAAASCDIGVYRGRSYFPQAWAHRQFTGGMVYGVDPYSRIEAEQVDTPQLAGQLKTWADATDFERLYDDVMDFCRQRDLDAHATLVRMPSASAAEMFRRQGVTFGLVHIDGNHDTAPVVRDVNDYVPLMRANSFLVLDDISWESVRPAIDLVEAAGFARLYELVDAHNDYAVFWNGRSRLRAAYLRAAMRWMNRARDDGAVSLTGARAVSDPIPAVRGGAGAD